MTYSMVMLKGLCATGMHVLVIKQIVRVMRPLTRGGAQLYQVNTHDVQVVIGASVGVAFGKHLEFVGALALKAELSSVNRGLEVRYNVHNHYVDEVVWPEVFSTG